MEDMISKIIELDKEAKESLTKAKQMKIDSEQKISDIKKQKRNEYIEKARANIKVLEKEEKVKAIVRLKVIENSYKKKYDRIEKIYDANKDKWIETIVDRVIKK
jgi:hypothetical protein